MKKIKKDLAKFQSSFYISIFVCNVALVHKIATTTFQEGSRVEESLHPKSKSMFPNQKRVCKKGSIGDWARKYLSSRTLTSAWFDTAQEDDDFLMLICGHRKNTSLRKKDGDRPSNDLLLVMGGKGG
jgi:hypothetical protein